MSRIKPPKIDKRQFSDLLEKLEQLASHYTPEWEGIAEEDPGMALCKIFSYIAGNVISRLNQVPDKNFVAFLDMLGIQLLPARPARVPLTFKLAPGTEKEILIPERTQAAADATDEHEELPFETEKNLLAIPASMVKVISIDPFADAIYVPPPGFLEGKLLEKLAHTYTIVSSTPENSSSLSGDKENSSQQVEEEKNLETQNVKYFQLDHVTGLKEGDILRIGAGAGPEYVVIEKISGTIVTITERLPEPVPAGVLVEKLTTFPLFEGKNKQEHSLYIGHKDLFNIKSNAVVNIEFTLTNLEDIKTHFSDFELIWEYWGKKKGIEGEEWYPFSVENNVEIEDPIVFPLKFLENDEEGRNSRETVELEEKNQTEQGFVEICEKDIKGIKSRWIRCRLKKPLSVEDAGKLPVLDKVEFNVESSGQDLVPELAFNNEIPLDVTKTFHPFGKEPRMFDNFAIGGKEIFSKKGANLTLDVKVETRGAVGSPAAILISDNQGNEKIKVFSRGPSGRLMELETDPAETDPGEPVWTDHGFPPDTRIAAGSTPAAIFFNGLYVSILARGENGHLIERFSYFNAGSNKYEWQWLDHGPPGKDVFLKFDPAVVEVYKNFLDSGVTDPQLVVFTAGSDGQLYEFTRTPGKEKEVGKWTNRERPNKPENNDIPLNIDSSPYVESYIKLKTIASPHDPPVIDIYVPLKPPGSPGLKTVKKPGEGKPEAGEKLSREEVQTQQTTVEYYGIKVFCKGKAEQEQNSQRSYLCELTLKWDITGKKLGEKDSPWSSYPGPGAFYIDSRPFAKVYQAKSKVKNDKNSIFAIVFVKGSDGQLWKLDTSNQKWTSYGKPKKEENSKIVESNIASDPHGFVSFDGEKVVEKRIFVRGADDCLWELDEDKYNKDNQAPNEKNGWRQHPLPGYSKLSFSPFVLHLTEGSPPIDVLHVFSAGSQNSVLERVIKLEGVPDENSWNEYKDPRETEPSLSWEYWNQKGWVVLKLEQDETANLIRSGKIRFILPEDSDETEIAGQKNHWIRARIVGGDYGKETFTFNGENNQKLESTKQNIRPPVIKSITISYKLEKKQYPRHCLTYNNLEYMVRTEECRTPGSHFLPFLPLQEKKKILYLGFEKFFKGGPIKIFFDAEELEDVAEDPKPKLAWEYSTKNEWQEMNYNDRTEALSRAEILEFLGEADFSGQSICGYYLYWLRASLVKGEYNQNQEPQLRGIYPNTTYALQTKTFENEILGSSSGEADQVFKFLNSPVQAGQQVRVREVIPVDEEEELLKRIGEDAMLEIFSEEESSPGKWVLWSEVSGFFDSTEKDRHYTLDRAAGLIRFGSGIHGMIPPIGENNIKAFLYQSGGGTVGNVKAGEIAALKTAVAGVDSVSNPAAADGGADTTTTDRMLEIGPAIISHRNRAVTPEDFEWLAKQASRKIVKARCLPNTWKNQQEIGWVTILIVPGSPAAQPFPSLQLCRTVERYLEIHCSNIPGTAKQICVLGPGYIKIGVSADVYAISLTEAAVVEVKVRRKLDAFFHPLTGGQEGTGWDFGRCVSASDVYALLEAVAGVDHVENLTFTANQVPVQGEVVEIDDSFLVSNGRHDIDIKGKQGG